MLNIEEQIQLKKEISHICDSGVNEIRIFEMVNNFINSRESTQNNSALLLPVKSKIDEIITDEVKRQYGTNYDTNSLESSVKGGEIIVEWMFNNL